MRTARAKVAGAEGGGEPTCSYFGGAERQLDTDVLGLCRPILESTPNLAVVARKTLANQAATSTAERSFSTAGSVLNVRRCRLDPARAEKLTVSAFRHRFKLRVGVPSFRVLETLVHWKVQEDKKYSRTLKVSLSKLL